MNKENVTRDLNVKIQPTLFDEFAKQCKSKYKTVSEVIRELMVEYIERQKGK
jgi:metal-responsive CopG/Arc/MetJ family transcriptional regulator